MGESLELLKEKRNIILLQEKNKTDRCNMICNTAILVATELVITGAIIFLLLT